MYDKKTLWVIIVLLVISVSLATIGTYRHFTNTDVPLVDDNPNHEFIYNNKVYFYYNDELISTYDCSNCSIAITTIDDTQYHTNYYKNGTESLNPIINSVQAIFSENDKVIVYDYNLQRVMREFEAIKTYNIANNNNLIMLKSNNLWQVYQLSEGGLALLMDESFDYVAIPNHMTDDNILDASNIITKNGDNWQIFDVVNNNVLTTTTEEIVDFNEYYYIAYNENYHIYNYNNIEILDNILKKYVAIIDNYTLVVTDVNTLLIYEDNSTTSIDSRTLPSYQDIDFVKSANGIDIILDGNLHDTIALN